MIQENELLKLVAKYLQNLSEDDLILLIKDSQVFDQALDLSETTEDEFKLNIKEQAPNLSEDGFNKSLDLFKKIERLLNT